MSSLINKKSLSALVALMPLLSQAQNLDLESPVKNIADQVVAVFPYVALIIFIIVVLINLGHFTKENGDWKKGLINIILFIVVLGVVIGFGSFIRNIKI